MKILITADVHFEKVVIKNKESCVSFIRNTIEKEKPDLFVIAGDTVDSHNLKSGSEEISELISFIKEIIQICQNNGTRLYVLRGTKGHDGEIMKNIYLSFKDTDKEFVYIDEPKVVCEVDGVNILFLPELYLPEYKDFIELMDRLTEYKMMKPEVIIFHGMIDFAIPQLKQVDSKYNLSRSIVINSKDIKDYVKFCAVGGHVHAQIQNGNIYYTDTMINSIGNTDMNKGMMVLDVNQFGYTIKRVVNPYNIMHKIVYLNFVERGMIEIDSELQTLKETYNLSEVIFRATINSNPEVLNNYTSFIRKYKPKYIKKIIQTADMDKNSNLITFSNKNKHSLTMDDIIKMVLNIADEKYHKNLEQRSVQEVLTTNKKN